MTSILIRRTDGSTAALNTLVYGSSSPAKLMEEIGFIQGFLRWVMGNFIQLGCSVKAQAKGYW